MAAYDLFGINRNDLADQRDSAGEIAVAKFLVEYRYGKNRAFQTRCRLTDVLRSTEWWEHVGCMLCFSATGTMEPDHTLTSCHRKDQLAMVKRTVGWLNTLEIARDSYPGRGFCSFCWLFHPCRYVANGTGVCDRRPIILQVVAVLSSQRNYRLGHVAAELAHQSGVDLSTEEGTRSWLQVKVPFPDPYNEGAWFPNLLLVYEALVISFYYQQNAARGVDPLLGFPLHPAGQTAAPTEEDGDRFMLMKDWEESKDWARAIAWWDGKCGFCVGRNLKGPHIRHSLQECTRGGKNAKRGDFGEALNEDAILPSSGCRRCHLPFPICGGWTQDKAGKWELTRPGTPRCQYSPDLLQDTMIGIMGSGNSSLREVIQDIAEEYSIGEDLDDPFDGETVACALSITITSEDNVVGSKMIQALWYITDEIWKTNGSS